MTNTRPEGPFKNTDREIWRERDDDYYASSIHVTEQGTIGMNVGGTVITMPIKEWHRLATNLSDLGAKDNQDARIASLEAGRERLRFLLSKAVNGPWSPDDLDVARAALEGE